MERVRNNVEEVRESFKRRGFELNVDFDRAVAGYEKRRSIQKQISSVEEEQYNTKVEIAIAKREKNEERFKELLPLQKQLKAKVVELEAELEETCDEYLFEAGAVRIPNTISEHTPDGDYDAAKTIKCFGQKRSFDFKPLDYQTLAMNHCMLDIQSGLHTTGPATLFLRGSAALLELALVNYAVHTLVDKGFEPVLPPDIVRAGVVQACGFETRSPEKDPLFRLAGEEDDLVLSGTAEMQLGGMCSSSARAPSQLPQRYVAISHCFRRESTKTNGLFRVHQFTKVEMFAVTDNKLEVSEKMLMEFANIQQEILESLGLHGRLLEMPSGELGKPAHRKLDTEVWMRAENKNYEYQEVCSASNCTDYQARRLQIYLGRYFIPRVGERRDRQFCHTVNGTGLAIPRIIIALLETCQQKDGSIVVPECLRPYMGNRDVLQPIPRKHTFHGDTSVRPLY